MLINHGVAQSNGRKEICHTVEMWGVSYIFLIRVSYTLTVVRFVRSIVSYR